MMENMLTEVDEVKKMLLPDQDSSTEKRGSLAAAATKLEIVKEGGALASTTRLEMYALQTKANRAIMNCRE